MRAYCREHLIEESKVALWIRSQKLYNKMEQEMALTQVSLLVHLQAGLAQVSRFRSVHTEEPIHRLTRDIYINRRKCQRPRSGGDVNL